MLESDAFVVKERVKVLAAFATYDILDPHTGKTLGTAEEKVGTLNQILRWFVSKHLMPTRVEVREKPDDSLVFTIRRGGYIFRSNVEVLDSQGELVGTFKSKFLTLSGAFDILDKDGLPFARIKGKWLGWDYRFLTPDGKTELGRVSKKLGLGGVLKELFTSADTYAVEVSPDLGHEPMAKMLLLAAALAIDVVYKSESRSGSGDALDLID